MTQKVNINSLWGYLIVEELVRNGVTCFCISPGSRSTPLVFAAANNPAAQSTVFYDERGAAFYALGYARATGKSAALICTSGTAVANYLPAVTEACQDMLPMVILSADRPPELRDAGANQTINQTTIFEKYLRWNFDLPSPDEKIKPEMVLSTIDQAVYRALNSPSGPVHINCMFREPLVPILQEYNLSCPESLEKWESSKSPLTVYSKSIQLPEGKKIGGLAEKINSFNRGILVVGQLKSKEEKIAVKQLAEKIKWPIFSDILSGLRSDSQISENIFYYDQLLFSDAFNQKVRPQIILHIGGQITSKRFLDFIEKYPPDNYFVIKDHPYRHDPLNCVTDRVEADISSFCENLAIMVNGRAEQALTRWIKKCSLKIENVIESVISKEQKISEISAARLISQYISGESGLFLSSSMPIRDMDMYADFNKSEIFVAANRGVSGIDGTIASACGFARGKGRLVTVVLGDLAMLHDLNSLMMVKTLNEPLIIVVINNRGGGIFSFLPVADFPDVFENYFETPHNYDFKGAAAMFGINYYRPELNTEFIKIYEDCQNKSESAIIEIQTDKNMNFGLHKELQKQIVETVDNLKYVGFK